MGQPLVEIAAGLQGKPVDLDEVRSSPLPAAGLYAWWRIIGSLPSVPAVTHPKSAELGLVYVGIGPKSATSQETLRSRLVGKHLNGNTGSSTLRLTLAAHLIDDLKFQPRKTVKKVVLSKTDNACLSAWMARNLRITWIAHPMPWQVEIDVIEWLRPPLNIDHNRGHPYCSTNQDLRATFKRFAVPDPEG